MATMTREEMLKALESACESYDWCTNNPNCDCPLSKFHRCPIVETDSLNDETVKLYYDIMFGKKIVTSTPTVDNAVTHPSHYTQGNVQCIDAMESAFGKEAVATWAKLNAFKYIWREEHKNGLQDIDKAIWYLNKYKELKTSG